MYFLAKMKIIFKISIIFEIKNSKTIDNIVE